MLYSNLADNIYINLLIGGKIMPGKKNIGLNKPSAGLGSEEIASSNIDNESTVPGITVTDALDNLGSAGGIILTTLGDLLVHGVAAAARLPVGVDGYVLKADSGEALGVKWAVDAASPTTTKGDISGFDTAAARIPVGSTFYDVLIVDSGEALGVKWGPLIPTKGMLITSNGSTTEMRGVGVDGEVLVAEASASSGLNWAKNPHPYDAVVAASGGDYTTLAAALTAGKTNVFITPGTYAETNDVVIPDDAKVVGSGAGQTIIDLGTNYSFKAGAQCVLSDLTVKSAKDAAAADAGCILLTGGRSQFTRVKMYLAHSSNPTNLVYAMWDQNTDYPNVSLTDCVITVDGDYANLNGVHGENAGSDSWTINGLMIDYSGNLADITLLQYNGNDAAFTNIVANNGIGNNEGIVIDGTDNKISNVSNIDFTVNGQNNAFSNVHTFSDFVVNSGSNYFANCKGVLTLSSAASNSKFINCYLTGYTIDSSAIACIFTACTMAGGVQTIPANYTTVTASQILGNTLDISGDGCDFSDNSGATQDVTVSGSYNRINSNKIGTPAGGTTDKIDLTGDYNICTSNFTDDTISDSGTGNVTANNIVF